MRRSRYMLIGLAVLALAVAGAAVIVRVLSSPVEPIGVVATPPALSADEAHFYENVAPALRAAAAEARSLTAQGQERSRNIFAIRAGQDRLEGHLRTIDAALATAVPARFAAVAESFRPAATDIRAAIRQAESAFLRFDWESVGAATEVMAAATTRLEAAVRQLDAAAGITDATPLATPPAAAGRMSSGQG